MHAVVMGSPLSFVSIAAVAVVEVQHHVSCLLHGHDPVDAVTSIICRRCLRTLPR